MRVAITGAGGFIGRATARALQSAGHHVLPIPHHDIAKAATVRPEALIHLGWHPGPGLLGNVEANEDALARSRTLLAAMADAGCCRIVSAGSGVEAAIGAPVSMTPYVRAKQQLHNDLAEWARAGREAVCAHIFSVTGPGEPAHRATPRIVRALLGGQQIDVSVGAQRRDILHVDDVANALVAVLGSQVVGTIDISAGEAPSLRHWFELLEVHTQTTGLVRYGAADLPPEELYDAIGDPTELFALGWRPGYSVEAIAADTVRSWRKPELLRG